MAQAAGIWLLLKLLNYSSHCLPSICRSRSAHCTATWIGDYAAITAAHCIYDRETKTFVDPKTLLFEPGVYTTEAGVKVTPHGAHKVAGIQYVSGYVTAPEPFYRFYDLAVVITQTPRTTGKLGFAWSPRGFEGMMNHAGYPGETPPFDSTGFRKTVFR
jgi:V8-like Glu-specific endopeptidase